MKKKYTAKCPACKGSGYDESVPKKMSRLSGIPVSQFEMLVGVKDTVKVAGENIWDPVTKIVRALCGECQGRRRIHHVKAKKYVLKLLTRQF